MAEARGALREGGAEAERVRAVVVRGLADLQYRAQALDDADATIPQLKSLADPCATTSS